MRKLTASLIGNRNGATFIGYGLLVGLIAIAVIAVATSVSPAIGGFDATDTGATGNHSVA